MSADRIDPWADDAAQRLIGRLDELKAGARRVEPHNWWLESSRLTDLGYVNLVLAVARKLHPRGTTRQQPIRVLDWGGGPGFLSYLLEALGLETSYYDLEYDYASYTYVQERLRGDVRYVTEDVALPYADVSFDAVISFGVLEHVPDPPGSLLELHRVLRPGGRLFVYHFPNRYGYIEKVAKALGRAHHDYKLSRRELIELVESAGFEVESYAYRYLLPRNLTDMRRLRGFVDRHSRGVYAADAALSKVPGLRALATTVNLEAYRP